MIWISSGVVKINPVSSVFIGCGSGSTVPPEMILDNLEANILVVWNMDRTSRLLLISVDTLFLGRIASQEIVAGLAPDFKSDEVFLAATHTHNAPMVDETKPNLGRINPDYRRFLTQQIVATGLKLARQEPIKVTMNVWDADLGGVVSRRNKRALAVSRYGLRVNAILQRPSFSSPKFKPQARMAEFVDSHGVVLATLAVVPCHAVAYMGLESISADVPGSLRNTLRTRNPGSKTMPFLFFQGASGDLNPWWKASFLTMGIMATVDQFINGPLFPIFKRTELSKWSVLRIQELFSFEKRQVDTKNEIQSGQIKSALFEYPLTDFLEKAVDLNQRILTIHSFEIENLKIIGASAELTWALRQELAGFLHGVELVGCVRDSFGYVASTSQVIEGGYETDGHHDNFSISNLRVLDTPKLILGLLRRALR